MGDNILWHCPCCRECQRLHPGYEFKLWTDASARELIAKEYPEYLAMYDGYGYGIQVRWLHHASISGSGGLHQNPQGLPDIRC